MKKNSLKKLALSVALLFGLIPLLHAQDIPEGYVEVPNYVEHFSSSSVANYRFNGPVDPLGWGSLRGDVGSSYMSYTATSSGKEGYCIYTSSTWRKSDWTTTPTTYFDIYDYIVTPLVKGDIKFFLKRYSTNAYYPPAVQLFKMHKDAEGKFYCDTIADRISAYSPDLMTELPNSTAWFEQSVDVGNEYCYVGIRMQCVYFDEFSASSALMPVNKVVQLGTISMADGYTTKVKTNSEGKIPVGYKFTVTNAGNVALSADGEGDSYSLTLARVISTATPYTYEEIARIPIPDLAVGETKTVEFISDAEVPDDLSVNSSGEVRFRVDVINNFDPSEDITKRTKTGSWFDITPYKAIMTIQYDKPTSKTATTATTVEAEKYINYGTVVGERGMEFSLTNKGAVDLVITSVDMPAWASIDNFNLPYTIAPDETKKINLKIAGDNGVKQGVVKFNFDGFAIADRIPVKAEVIDSDEYYTDFENEESLKGWLIPSGTNSWKIAEYTSTERNYNENFNQVEYLYNDSRLENGNNNDNAQYIYSPKLAFAEGDSLAFYAAKRTNSGNSVRLEMAYSTDRANWTDMGTITVTNSDPAYQFSSGTSTATTSNGQGILKRFAFEMPEGEFYVRFGAGYVLVDDFHGGTLVDVDYDIVSESITMGNAKMINVPVTATATFRNLLDEEVTAGEQTVTLYANGEPVAQAEPVDIAGVETVSYDFSYIPHVAGEHSYYAELAIGDYKCVSPVARLVIQEESAVVESQIGEIKTNDGGLPLYLGYSNSVSETVYKAELLDAVDGQITALTYKYYKTGNPNTSEKLRIWLANSDDAVVPTKLSELTDVADMQLVYEYDGFVFEKMGGSGDYRDLEFILDTPFEYEKGKNLRVVVENLGTNYVSANFAQDNTPGIGTSYYYAADNRDTFLNRTGYSYGSKSMVPVVVITTAKSVEPVSGVVKDTAGNGIEGATVRATAIGARTIKARAGEAPAPDVYYETVTDEDGNWSMEIIQNGYDYVISVKAPGYEVADPVALDWDNMSDIDFVLGEEEIVHPANGTYTSTYTDDGRYLNVDIKWAMGNDNTSEEFRGYTFDIALDGEHHGTTTKTSYRLENMTTGNYEVSITGTTPSGATTNTHVVRISLDILTGVVGIEAQEGEWRYFDLNGIEIRADQLDRGFYIRTNGRKTEKILINK